MKASLKCTECTGKLEQLAYYCCDNRVRACNACAVKRCRKCNMKKFNTVVNQTQAFHEIMPSSMSKTMLGPALRKLTETKKLLSCFHCRQKYDQEEILDKCGHKFCHKCADVFYYNYFMYNLKVQKDTGVELDIEVEMGCECFIDRQVLKKFLVKRCIYCHCRFGTSLVNELKDGTKIHIICLEKALERIRCAFNQKDYNLLVLSCQSCTRAIDGVKVSLGHKSGSLVLCHDCYLSTSIQQKIFDIRGSRQLHQNRVQRTVSKQAKCPFCDTKYDRKREGEQAICQKCSSKQNNSEKSSVEQQKKQRLKIPDEKLQSKEQDEMQIEIGEQEPIQAESPLKLQQQWKHLLTAQEQRDRQMKQRQIIQQDEIKLEVYDVTIELQRKKVEVDDEQVESHLVLNKENSINPVKRPQSDPPSRISSLSDPSKISSGGGSSKLSDEFLPPRQSEVVLGQQHKITSCLECGLKDEASLLLRVKKAGLSKGLRVVEKDEKFEGEVNYWCQACYIRYKMKTKPKQEAHAPMQNSEKLVKGRARTSVQRTVVKPPQKEFTTWLPSTEVRVKPLTKCIMCRKEVPPRKIKKGAQICNSCQLEMITQ